ncbi:MAG TPA: glycosyltransferase N-terminal domain-containing protein, partial [Verrucomicrobiales bacterium]|nr:glycosyltransferase N-terminal domain-containing protein [Verrucomicrobiales bacterium]
PIVLSVTTSTGHAVAVSDAPVNLTVIYSPVDFGWIVRAVLRCVQPQKYILMEAELWPNLVRRAKKRGIPVALANARLSPRSERRYRKWRWLAGPLFSMLDLVLVQDEGDAARWSGIGVPEGRIVCTGSIKYDLAGDSGPGRTGEFKMLLTGLFGEPLPPLLLAASTHPGEEKMLAAIFLELRRELPALALLVAPRHFERREEVKADLASLGLEAALRSSLTNITSQPDVLVIDSTGELRDWQALASVVVIGKSFLATGGQNPAEAIAAGVPVIAGPHMENFQPLMELLRNAGGITEVPSAEALLPALRNALAGPEAALATAARGRQALERHRGAAVRTAEAIAAL